MAYFNYTSLNTAQIGGKVATRNEKLQSVIDLIYEKYGELIKGNEIRLTSYIVDKNTSDVTLAEQLQALEVLANDYKLINYTIEALYVLDEDEETHFTVDYELGTQLSDIPERNEDVGGSRYVLYYQITILQPKKPILVHKKPVDDRDKVKRIKVTYDPISCMLLCGTKTCSIPDGTLQHYVCKMTFANSSEPVNELDILDEYDSSKDSPRAIYDAVLAINRKAKTAFGIERLLALRAGKVRITPNNQ